ncbi:MAG: hypothetical protein AAFQ94_14330 [Bacteroidota bacterium]
MRNTGLILALLVCSFLTVPVSAQFVPWGVSPVSGPATINGLAMETNGETYVTGHYNSGITFEVILPGTGFFLAKYDDDGQPIWSLSAGSGNDRGLDVAVDNSGNSFTGGYFRDEITFGAGGSATTLNTTLRAGFLVKHDNSGNMLWAVKIGGGNNNDQIQNVIVDEAGDCYVSGLANDIGYFAKYSGSTGALLWSRTDLSPPDISTDGVNIYVVGVFRGLQLIDGIEITSGTAFTNIYVGKISGATGQFTRITTSDIRVSEQLRIASDPTGNVYVAGARYTENYAFGSDLQTGNLFDGGNRENVFIAKYDAGGNEQWAREALGVGNPGPRSWDLAANEFGVFAIGDFITRLDFGGGNLVEAPSTSVSLRKSFLARFSTAGVLEWLKVGSDIGSDEAYRVAANNTGKVNIAGRRGGRSRYECIDLSPCSLCGFSVRYLDATNPLIGPIPPNASQKPNVNPISGTVNVCQGQSGVAYSTTPIPGIPNYTWTVPAGATIVSGSNTANITVDFSASAVGGEVTVKAVSATCESDPETFRVNVGSISNAATARISGAANVVPGQKSVAYSAISIIGSTSYDWTLPGGVTFASGSGTNSSFILVDFSETATDGVISVKGVSACGESSVVDFNVTVSSLSISGTINTPDNVPVNAVTVTLDDGSSQLNETTPAGGSYLFDNLQAVNYTVRPAKNNNLNNGVNVLDFILLRRHVLSTPTLTSYFQLIAADIDNSGVVDSNDILLFADLRSGNPVSESWRFVPANYTFPTTFDPVNVPAYPDSRGFNPLNSAEGNVDFIGVKIGDLNGSSDPGQ